VHFCGLFIYSEGYKCWDPIGKRLLVSMDVTFREEDPYYRKKVDSYQILEDFSRSMEETVERGRMTVVEVVMRLVELQEG
jgi:hypothetical protein